MIPIAIISALAQFAPQITKWLNAGKTVQDVAEKAGDIARVITGESDTDSAVASLQQNPELAAKYAEAVLAQDLEYEKLYVTDKADARKRDTALMVAGGNTRANLLVLFACLVVVSITVALVANDSLNDYAKTTIALVLGMFLNELKNIYSFEFGTTRRARENTDALTGLANDIVKKDKV